MFDLPSKESASGLFSVAHLVSSVTCLLLVALLVYLTRKASDRALKQITRVMAIVFCVLEIIKITFKLLIGEGRYIDHYLPLFFCSLFIYSLFLCGFGKGKIYKTGCVFLSSGCAISGLLFLIFPTTSLPDYPFYHFISLHSMLFHSSMVYMGIMYMKKRYVRLDGVAYLYYVCFVAVPIVLSLVLNPIFESNLMLLSVPTNLPIDFVNEIFKNAPFVYTLGACALYLVLPFFVTKGLLALCDYIKNRKTCR